MISFRFGGQKRSCDFGLLQEPVTFSMLPEGDLDLLLIVKKKKKFLAISSVIGNCGPVPIREMYRDLEGRPFCNWFPLLNKGVRVGKLFLEFSLSFNAEELEEHSNTLHKLLLSQLCARLRLSLGSLAPALSNASTARSSTDLGLQALGYVYDEEAVMDMEEPPMSPTSESSLEAVEEPKFPWVMGPSKQEVAQAVATVQECATRIGDKLLSVVDQFYDNLSKHPTAAARFARTPIDKQKAKFLPMLKTLILNMHKPEEILGEVKAMALRHVGYGVELADYDIVGFELLRCLKGKGESGFLF